MNGDDLKHFSLCGELSQADRELLVQELEERAFDSQGHLFHEGDEGDGLFLIVEGEVELLSRKAGRLGTGGPGTALGTLSLVAPGPRETSARAISELRALCLDRARFRRLMQDAPQVASKLQEAILRELASTLREGMGRIVDSDR